MVKLLINSGSGTNVHTYCNVRNFSHDGHLNIAFVGSIRRWVGYANGEWAYDECTIYLKADVLNCGKEDY